MLTSRLGDTSFGQFSELERDAMRVSYILSRSMAGFQRTSTRCFSHLQGFIGRVEGDIDDIHGKLAHHLQDRITAARMVPIARLYLRLSSRRSRRGTLRQHVELVSPEVKPSRQTISFSKSLIPVHLVRNSVATASAKRRPHRRRQVSHRQYHVRAYQRTIIYIGVEDDGGG